MSEYVDYRMGDYLGEYILDIRDDDSGLIKEKIVRCRDCKLFDNRYLKCFRPVLYFDHDYNPHWTDETTFTAVTDATPDGFCKWGNPK